MTGIQYISQLPTASGPGSTDIIPLTQGSAGPGTGTTRKTTLAEVGALVTGVINVKMSPYNAVGDGFNNDLGAINAAITAANALPFGGTVFLPPGKYRIATNAGNTRIVPKSNVTLAGAGRGVTTIYMDDQLGGTDMIGNGLNDGSWTALTNFHMRDFTVLGRADVTPTSGGQIIRIGYASQITLDNIESKYSRNMGMVITNTDQVVVRNCRVYRSIADGIAVWDCPNALITENEVYGANDDAISAHSNDATAAPVRSGVVITDNLITESQGIKCLGPKQVTITGNKLSRMMSYGIVVQSPFSNVQGDTAGFNAIIANNTIQDVFFRQEPSPRNTLCVYIWIGGGQRRSGGGASPPGEPVAGTGVVASLYGTTTGNFYANNVDTGTVPTPAGRGFQVLNNTCLRTLAAVTNVSDWGYGSSGLWVGNNGSGTGFYNGTMTEAGFNGTGIQVEPSFYESRIAGNIIQATCGDGIRFAPSSGGSIVSNDFRNLIIEGNLFSDYSNAGILMPAASTVQAIILRNNTFDGDPRFRHANRGANGTWLANAAPYGIYTQTTDGVMVEGNRFRNVANTLENAGSGKLGTVRGNVAYGEPSALGFSTSNRGCGTVYRTGLDGQYLHIHEDATPTSATYGHILTNPVVAATAMPATGTWVTGHVVYNSAPSVGAYMFWVRMNVGSGNVLDVDWRRGGLVV